MKAVDETKKSGLLLRAFAPQLLSESIPIIDVRIQQKPVSGEDNNERLK
jgi:hypothetical protein